MQQTIKCSNCHRSLRPTLVAVTPQADIEIEVEQCIQCRKAKADQIYEIEGLFPRLSCPRLDCVFNEEGYCLNILPQFSIVSKSISKRGKTVKLTCDSFKLDD